MKKIFNTILVLTLLVLVPTFIVSAESGTNDNTGTITIENAIEGKTYKAYQILELESYNTEKEAYTYKVTEAWEGFFEEGAAGYSYVTVDDENIATWKEGKDGADDMKTFAQEALKYAQDNNIKATKEDEDTTTTVKFEELNLGYYLIDSSVGALCSLTTTKPSAKAEEKNTEPTVKKEVNELSGDIWGDKNTASIGDTVNFRTTITASDGAENYVLYDTMTEGLTLDEKSITVTFDGKTLTKGTDYTVSFDTKIDEDKEETYTFVITFADSFTDTLKANNQIIVTYSALLNEKAVIAGDGNTNKTYLEYGDETDTTNKTTEDKTTTYTYEFDLVKTDKSNELLDGAVFELYSKTDNTKITLVLENGVYRVATANDETTITQITITVTNGKVTIKGLDNGLYYLTELTPPAGYNKLTTNVEFEIKDNNLKAETVTQEVAGEEDEESTTITKWTDGGVHVINYTGSELPTTGGVGTILFITIGSIMVLGFGVLLVTKLRMAKMSA